MAHHYNSIADRTGIGQKFAFSKQYLLWAFFVTLDTFVIMISILNTKKDCHVTLSIIGRTVVANKIFYLQQPEYCPMDLLYYLISQNSTFVNNYNNDEMLLNAFARPKIVIEVRV